MSDDGSILREQLITKMEMGTAIHISNSDSGLNYRARVAGYDRGILITSLPSAKQLQLDSPDYDEFFSDEMLLVMRLIVDGVIYAFKSEVLAINLKACKLLISSLPEKIQTRPLRMGVRYPCVLQAGFVLGETKYRGVLTNISEGGCLFRMKAVVDIESIKALVANDRESSLCVRFPFNDKDLSFEIKVKSVSNEETGYFLLGTLYSEPEKVVPVIKKYFEFMQLEELAEYLQ